MTADDWADFLLKRGPELRQGGILSIGVEGCSAALAPAEPRSDDSSDVPATPLVEDPKDHWENPENYPGGVVPSFDVDEKLEDIPEFNS